MICQACGVEAPTKYVAFHQNIGLLVVRLERTVKGKLCKSCVHRYFWGYTSTCFFLGWWGYVSFVLNPVFIVNNFVRYLGCLTMKRVPRGAVRPRLGVDEMMQLQPYTEEIIARLNGKQELEAIAADVAPRAQVTPAQVVMYTVNLIETMKRKN